MFNPMQVVIEAFVEQLQARYGQTYGTPEPDYPGIIGFIARLATENIANSDAPYHDMNHTIMVTLVGQEILRGKHISEGGVTPRNWLHFIISLLCHDIGYVRGVCRGDADGQYVCDAKGDIVTLPDGSTDASLTPYHVTRSKLFVRERFGKVTLIPIDTMQIEANIEHTRFPVPEDEQHKSTADYPGLVRAADLIGQLADVNYLRKIAALFAEFRETGISEKFGFRNPEDLRRAYPGFFWKAVKPYRRCFGVSARHSGRQVLDRQPLLSRVLRRTSGRHWSLLRSIAFSALVARDRRSKHRRGSNEQAHSGGRGSTQSADTARFADQR
jgi:hypothetical protein